MDIASSKQDPSAIGLIAIEVTEAEAEATPAAVEALPSSTAAAVAELPAPAPLPIPGPEPVGVEPVDKVEAEDNVEAGDKKPSKWASRFAGLTGALPMAALAMSVIASTASVAGLLMASRTIAKAEMVMADAEQRQAKLRQIEKIAVEIENLNHKQNEALARVDQMVAMAKPATTQDVRGSMNELQVSLSKILPATNGEMYKLRDSQTELANRINTLYSKIDHMERSLNATPKASRAAGQAPTS